MKSLAEIYNNGTGIKAQQAERKAHVINEIEKQFNQIFKELRVVFPAMTAIIKSQSDLDTFKRQWLLTFAESGITTLKQFEVGMKKARQQNNPFVISPGQFVSWCKEGEAQSLGLPNVVQIMKEFRLYNATRLDYESPELFPWSQPVMYWIVTNLRKYMMQYNQSDIEVEKRAEYLLIQWTKKISRGEKVPEIRIQIENKVDTPYSSSFQYNHPLIKKMRERIEAAKRSNANG